MRWPPEALTPADAGSKAWGRRAGVAVGWHREDGEALAASPSTLEPVAMCYSEAQGEADPLYLQTPESVNLGA